MMQPYTKSSILLNTPIEYSKRNLYTYQWYVNNELISTDWKYNYKFTKDGIHNIKLIITDIDSKYQSISGFSIQTVIPRQDYIVSLLPPPNPYYTITVSPNNEDGDHNFNVEINRFNGYSDSVNIIWQKEARYPFALPGTPPNLNAEWHATINGIDVLPNVDTVITNAPDTFSIVFTENWMEGGNHPGLSDMYLMGQSGIEPLVISNIFEHIWWQSTFGEDYGYVYYPTSDFAYPIFNEIAAIIPLSYPDQFVPITLYMQRRHSYIKARWDESILEESTDDGITWTSSSDTMKWETSSAYLHGAYLLEKEIDLGTAYYYRSPITYNLHLKFQGTHVVNLTRYFEARRDISITINGIEPIEWGSDPITISNDNGQPITVVSNYDTNLYPGYLILNVDDVDYPIQPGEDMSFRPPDNTTSVYKVILWGDANILCETYPMTITNGLI